LRDPLSDLAWRELRVREIILTAIHDRIASLSSIAEARLTLDDVRADLVTIGRNTPLDQDRWIAVLEEERAIAEERERFCVYVERTPADELQRASAEGVPT
jgi:hypothetical protein